MRLTRCRLRHCRCFLYIASVKLLEPCTLMRHSGVTLLSGYIMCCFWLALVFRLLYKLPWQNVRIIEDGTHGLKIMRLTRCRLRHCRCLLYSASVKLLEPCTLMRHSGVTLLSGYILCCFWLALVFRLLYKLPWQNVRIIEDGIHGVKNMRLTRCWLRHCRCLHYGASVKFLQPCTMMQHSGITAVKLFFVRHLVGSGFSPLVCITVTKIATSEDRTHDLNIMRLTRCRLRHCRCLLYSASVKLLEPCTLMLHSGVTLLSGYILCCFWLALVFRLLYKLLWQNVRIIEDGIHGVKNMRLTRRWLRHCRCLHYGASVKFLQPCTMMQHSGITAVKLFFVPHLVGSGFSPLVCFTVTKIATSEDRTHDLNIMRLTRCRLRHCHCLFYSASVKLLEPCTLMRHSGVTLLSGYILCCFWLALVFRLLYKLPWQNVRITEDGTHGLKNMWLTRCRLRHCRCLLYSASVKLLEPCTLMLHSGVTLLSGYILCCFWLALVFRL